MIGHSITNNMSDGYGTLVALSFDTGRVAVSWGSGYVSHTSVYQWVPNEWGGAWHFVHIDQGILGDPWRAMRDESFGRLESNASELEVTVRGCGPSTSDFQNWLRAEAGRITGEQAELERRVRELSAVGDYGAEAQKAFAELRYDDSLPTKVHNLSNSAPRTRTLAGWLAALGSRLMSGEEIFAFAGQHHAPIAWPGCVDDVIYVAVELGLAKPYDYDPRPGGHVGESDGLLTAGEQAAWRKHQRGPWGKHQSVVGTHLWTFSQGPRYDELLNLLPRDRSARLRAFQPTRVTRPT